MCPKKSGNITDSGFKKHFSGGALFHYSCAKKTTVIVKGVYYCCEQNEKKCRNKFISSFEPSQTQVPNTQLRVAESQQQTVDLRSLM